MKNPWIEAARLRTLPVSAAGVLVAWAYAIGNGCFKALPGVLCLVFALLCQTASNFANEYYDYRAGRDRVGREGPRRGVTEGDISPEAMKRATYFLLSVAAVIGLSLTYWGGLWLIAAGALIFVGALAYSAGPWPLSTHCLGEVAVFFFFGMVPVSLTYYLMDGDFPADVLRGAAAMGLLGANVLIVNNYRDIPDDRLAHKHTLATELGRNPMMILYVLNAIGASAFMFGAWDAMGGYWIVAPILLVLWSIRIAARMSRLEGARLNPYLGITSILMVAYAVTFLVAQSIA